MMSQSELAKLLGVTQTHMSNLERGRCGITVTMLNELTNIFEVETDALLYGTPGPIRIQALQVLLKQWYRKLHPWRFNQSGKTFG